MQRFEVADLLTSQNYFVGVRALVVASYNLDRPHGIFGQQFFSRFFGSALHREFSLDISHRQLSRSHR